MVFQEIEVKFCSQFIFCPSYIFLAQVLPLLQHELSSFSSNDLLYKVPRSIIYLAGIWIIATERESILSCFPLSIVSFINIKISVECGICSPCTLEVKARESEIQGHPQQHNEFKVSLGYMRLHIKKTRWIKSNKYIS